MYITWPSNDLEYPYGMKKYTNNIVQPITPTLNLECNLKNSFPRPHPEALTSSASNLTQDLSTEDLLVLLKTTAKPSSTVFYAKKRLPSHIFQTKFEIYDLGDSINIAPKGEKE